MRIFLTFVILSLLLALPFSVSARESDEVEYEWEGVTFDLDNIDGDSMSEEDVFIGADVYLVDFWASWCHPCSQYLPHLEQMVEDYKDRNFKVVIFCVDNAATIASAKSTIAAEDYPFTILFDTESSVKEDLGVRNIPTTILFDKEGEELWRHAGYTSGVEDEVREHVELYLTEKEDSD